MSKKDTLKANLIRKKPIIQEEEAAKVVKQVHKPKPEETEEEPTTKTSVDIRKSLYKAMKIKLLDEEITMRQYLERLIEADLNK